MDEALTSFRQRLLFYGIHPGLMMTSSRSALLWRIVLCVDMDSLGDLEKLSKLRHLLINALFMKVSNITWSCFIQSGSNILQVRSNLYRTTFKS